MILIKPEDKSEKERKDERFIKYDEMITSSNNDKVFYILSLCASILIFIIVTSSIMDMVAVMDETKYENGLNISYDPHYRYFHITFDNPNNDTLKMSTVIKIPFDTSSYINQYIESYNYETSTFPSEIKYHPPNSSMNINHIVIVTLTKNNGTYAYMYQTLPSVENQYWVGTGQYINSIFGSNTTQQTPPLNI